MISDLAYVVYVLLQVQLWLIIGRYALKLISFGKQTFFTELFRRGTDPWFRLVRRVTPAGVGDGHIPLLGVLLIFNLLLLLSLVPGMAR
jgi:hypothetical protein